MTKREFYNCVIEMTEAEGIENIKFENEELTVKGVAEYAIAQITNLDETNEKRRNAVSKKALENVPLMERIFNEILTDKAQTASEVAEVMELSVQKVSYLLRALVADGKATVEDVKIPKKGKCKAYTKVVEVEDVEAATEIEE